MKHIEELSELSKSVYFKLKRACEMISAGANIQLLMCGSHVEGEGGQKSLSTDYSYFQACMKVRGTGTTAEAITTIRIYKDGSGTVEVGVNNCKSNGKYTSVFVGSNDFIKELFIIEYFLKRNFID